MLDDSHTMLAQLRNAVDHERCERIKAGGLLEQEQKRTRVLLEVLRNFKAKLQGIAPHKLASQAGFLDMKELATIAGTMNGLDVKTTPGTAVGSAALSQCPPIPAKTASVLGVCPKGPLSKPTPPPL